jgi:hypothetical protein
MATQKQKAKKTRITAKAPAEPEYERQILCHVETALFRSPIINKLMEKNDEQTIIYSPFDCPVEGLIRWGEKLTIKPPPVVSSASSILPSVYESDSDFDDSGALRLQSQQHLQFEQAQPTEVSQYFDHMAVVLPSEVFVKSLLHPYISMANGTYSPESTDCLPFYHLQSLLLLLQNRVRAVACPLLNRPVSVYLLLVDLEASLLKVQREMAQLMRNRPGVVGNVVIPSGILEDGLANVSFTFGEDFQLFRVKSVVEGSY